MFRRQTHGNDLPFMLGNAIGPVLGGYIFDTTDSYRALFGLSAAASAISIVFISLMRKEYGSRQPQDDI